MENSCREARKLFHGSRHLSTSPGCHRLEDVISEYVALKRREEQRARLRESNSIANAIYALLDSNAGIDQGIAPPMPLLGANNLVLNFSPLAPLNPDSHVQNYQIEAQYNTNAEALPTATAAVNQRPDALLSPKRHGARKRPPKKRERVDGHPSRSQQSEKQPSHDEQKFSIFSPGNSQDSFDPQMFSLLNKPMTLEGLELLLDDATVQHHFAEPVAEHINRYINEKGTENPTEFSIQGLNAEEWLPPLVEDPRMAELIEHLTCAEGTASRGGEEESALNWYRSPNKQRKKEATRRYNTQIIDSEAAQDSNADKRPPISLSRALAEVRDLGFKPDHHQIEQSGARDKKNPRQVSQEPLHRSKESNLMSSSRLESGTPRDISKIVPKEIANYISRPEDFEDLINECIG